MIIWKKKLIRCCKCGKAYSFDDNLFYHLKEYILICPNCNLMHKVDIKLLGKEYEGLEKIDRLNLTAIDIGSAAVEGDDYWGGQRTIISVTNPANASGVITSVEIYAQSGYNLANCEVATFYRPNPSGFPNNFTTRDYETVDNGNGAGVVVGGSKQTFTVSLDVVAGDYIGFWASNPTGRIRSINVATPNWFIADEDHVPCTNVTFGTGLSGALSIYGTGATEEEATDNAIMMGFNF